MEIIDLAEKVKEFNAGYGTSFKLGLGTMWMPRRQEFERETLYICRIKVCIDMIDMNNAERLVSAGFPQCP